MRASATRCSSPSTASLPGCGTPAEALDRSVDFVGTRALNCMGVAGTAPKVFKFIVAVFAYTLHPVANCCAPGHRAGRYYLHKA